MNTIFKSIGFTRRRLVPALFLGIIILAVFLLPQELSFRAPRQEYENNDIKKSMLIFSKPSGFYKDAFTLKIKAPTREIYYTLDGTEPVRDQENTFRSEGGIEISDATSQENVHSMRTDVTPSFDADLLAEYAADYESKNYTVPDYPVDKCTILRAVFYDEDGQRSGVETASYFVGYDGREGYGKIKTVSIVTDPANLFDFEKGIYVMGKTFDDFAAADSFHNKDLWYRHVWWWWDANYNRRGRDWERQVNVQFFDEGGSLLLQQEAGIRIQGGGSRGFLPKSLNLYARKDYDGNSSFHYDFFDTGFNPKRITLTTGGDDFYTKQKDRLVCELAADQGFATMHYEPCLVFLDGEFWGVCHLTEKYDEKYFSYYYNVPEENVVEIKSKGIEVGLESDTKPFEKTKKFITENDMSDPDNYAQACELIDMDSFINYYAVLVYCARCGDWPNGNYAVWHTREAPEELFTLMAENEERTDSSDQDTDTGDTQDNASGEKNAETSDSAEDGTGDGSGENAGSPEDSAADAVDPNPKDLDITGKTTSDSPYTDGRWRWVLFDVNSAAISSELKENDTLNYILNKDPSPLFVSLSKNEEFREKFSDRILEYGRTIFSPESVNAKLDQYHDEMDTAMAIYYRRFFGDGSGLDFEEITDTEIRSFFENRYSVVEKMLQEHFGDM